MDTQIETSVTKKRRLFSWQKLSVLFSLLTLIILMGLGYCFSQYNKKIQVQQNESDIAVKTLQTQVVNLETQNNQLAQHINEQASTVNALQQIQTGLNRNEWLILEAEFLVKLANDQLQFENNPAQAIRLLQAADKQIHTLDDASLLPIRKALADDIANLQGIAQVDIQGTYLQLSALNEQINKLPLQAAAEGNIESPLTKTNESTWWKKGLQETWKELKQIVKVRYREAGKQPLILPESREYLYLNLHSAMEKTMWGLLHKQPEIYEASLTQMIQWIKTYFIIDSPVTQNLLTHLETLQKINVRPTLPMVSASLQAFQEYFALHKQ